VGVCGKPRLYCVLYAPRRGAPNVNQVRVLHNSHTRKPALVNPDHVRTATEADSHKTVRLVIGEAAEEVEGDLKSVWETLTRTPVDLTWKRDKPDALFKRT
jgi:hypothetical protein